MLATGSLEQSGYSPVPDRLGDTKEILHADILQERAHVKKLSYRQQQQRLGLGVVIIFIVVALLAFGGDLLKLQSIYTPDIAGFQKMPPSGDYAVLDWKTLVQATSRTAGEDFPAAIKKLDDKPVVVTGYMFPQRKKDGTVDETPVDNLMLTQEYYAHVPSGCGPGCQNPVGVALKDENTVAVTDWPFRLYGTLKLNPKVYGSGADVQITDAVAVIGR